jgi:hypothetical protein
LGHRGRIARREGLIERFVKLLVTALRVSDETFLALRVEFLFFGSLSWDANLRHVNSSALTNAQISKVLQRGKNGASRLAIEFQRNAKLLLSENRNAATSRRRFLDDDFYDEVV